MVFSVFAASALWAGIHLRDANKQGNIKSPGGRQGSSFHLIQAILGASWSPFHPVINWSPPLVNTFSGSRQATAEASCNWNWLSDFKWPCNWRSRVWCINFHIWDWSLQRMRQVNQELYVFGLSDKVPWKIEALPWRHSFGETNWLLVRKPMDWGQLMWAPTSN